MYLMRPPMSTTTLPVGSRSIRLRRRCSYSAAGIPGVMWSVATPPPRVGSHPRRKSIGNKWGCVCGRGWPTAGGVCMLRTYASMRVRIQLVLRMAALRAAAPYAMPRAAGLVSPSLVRSIVVFDTHVTQTRRRQTRRTVRPCRTSRRCTTGATRSAPPRAHAVPKRH